jgi:hypothetical protein
LPTSITSSDHLSKDSVSNMPSTSDESGPGLSTVRPGIVAPIVASRDPGDPLDPSRIARLDLSCAQAKALYRELVRTARHPESEPDWPQVIACLRRHLGEYRDCREHLETAWGIAKDAEGLLSRLSMDDRENIAAYVGAKETSADLLSRWGACDRACRELAAMAS